MNLQEQLDAVIEQISQLDPNNRDNLVELAGLEQKKAVLTMQIEDTKAQEAVTQERIQAQVEKVESITLPYDFNEVFDDPRANEMIIELIKDLQHQAYAEHNAEVEVLVAENKAQLAEERTKREEIYKQLGITSNMFNELETEHNTLRNDYQKAILELEDTASKRDAAAREIEGLETLLAEKQKHIDKLRDEIAIGAKAAINVTNISPTDRLAVLVEQSKNAKVKSAIDIALETPVPFRGKVIVDQYGQAVAELNTPEVGTFPIVNPSSDTGYQLVTGPTESIPTDDQVTFPEEATEVSTVPAPVAEGDASEIGKTLEERVKALELHVFGA